MGDRGRIMIVEDDPTIRQLMAEILRDAGHEVVECASGEEALSHLNADPPLLITLDLAMPSMDGLEFLRVLRERSDPAEIPVVVVTAAPAFLRHELLKEGHLTLAKPFHMEQLLEVVEHLLGQRRSAT